MGGLRGRRRLRRCRRGLIGRRRSYALALAGLTGLVTRLARAIPPVDTAGLQLGLGFALAVLGVRLTEPPPWLGLAIAALATLLIAANYKHYYEEKLSEKIVSAEQLINYNRDAFRQSKAQP